MNRGRTYRFLFEKPPCFPLSSFSRSWSGAPVYNGDTLTGLDTPGCDRPLLYPFTLDTVPAQKARLPGAAASIQQAAEHGGDQAAAQLSTELGHLPAWGTLDPLPQTPSGGSLASGPVLSPSPALGRPRSLLAQAPAAPGVDRLPGGPSRVR